MLHSAESAFVTGTSDDRRRRAPVAAADSVTPSGYGNQAMLRMQGGGARAAAPTAGGVLQRKCDCGDTRAGGAAEGVGSLQRSPAGTGEPATTPPITDDVLASAGQPLDAATRAYMEPRFRHDFSQVRVHTDAKAAESARLVNARAYTVGNHLVFGAGRFATGSFDGRKLLAHELTHTIQQTGMGADLAALSDRSAEREAERNGADVAAGSAARVDGRAQIGVMQKDDDNALDEKAKKIIEAGKDTSKPIDQRAIDAVNSIVKAYYDPALVEKVIYDESTPGLKTSPIGKDRDIKGQITVGKYFIENIDSFGRRVLQVGHELQHVQQQRAGMGGSAKKNEREFLAFHWEATQPEKTGTGKMPHATRVALIDEALKNYYCMPEADQKTHADKKDALLKLRGTEETASGHPHTEPPAACTRKK